MIYISTNNGRHPVTKNFTPLHYTLPNYTSLHFTTLVDTSPPPIYVRRSTYVTSVLKYLQHNWKSPKNIYSLVVQRNSTLVIII